MADVVVTYTPDAVLNQLLSQKAKMDAYTAVRPADNPCATLLVHSWLELTSCAEH